MENAACQHPCGPCPLSCLHHHMVGPSDHPAPHTPCLTTVGSLQELCLAAVAPRHCSHSGAEWRAGAREGRHRTPHVGHSGDGLSLSRLCLCHQATVKMTEVSRTTSIFVKSARPVLGIVYPKGIVGGRCQACARRLRTVPHAGAHTWTTIERRSRAAVPAPDV
jgi:hypothetical protein